MANRTRKAFFFYFDRFKVRNSSLWKRDRENEPLPPGLHYSIDFTTGERKAKLLDPEDALPNPDAERTSVVVMPEDEAFEKEEKPELTEAQKASIKKINDYLDEQELVISLDSWYYQLNFEA